MLKKIGNILRTYLVPIAATALAIFFWRKYECQGYWWFPYITGMILLAHYFFYFRKMRSFSN